MTAREAERTNLFRVLNHLCIASALLTVGLILGGEIGCAPKNPVTVTTPTTIDLTLARALDTAQASIEEAKVQFAGNIAAVAPLNKVITSYNACKSAYLIYHTALVNGLSPDAATLKQQIAQLTTDIASLTSQFGTKK
jgi:hypothetical protein